LRPAHIRILGKRFTVGNGPLKDDLVGECDTDAQTIYVKDGLPLDSEQDVLLHEVIHAVDEMVDAKMKESQVKRLATGLLAVLKDNPRFVSFLRRKK